MKKKEDEHIESKRRKIILHYPDDTPAGYIEYNGDSSKVYDENDNFLFEVNGIFPPKPKSSSDFSWIDKVLEKGIQDGRKRFILYVASRYLVNIKGLGDEEAIQALKEFYYKVPTGKIYDSWLKSVVNGVKNKGLLPWSLEKISEKDKEMYNEIIKILKS
ncbi:hypothetical protein BFU36_03380 [Sulfolobus sp. A20]|uniref:DNA primase noncatalytic subunit PriX n=2 Tax=Sulfolobaceae TaxID=118883 RepID=UPI000845EADC|nr:DNA primase noncatalytic subunit PriX [Sulfolobus sp. A20]TRM73972.1 DNA primase noncatalytic subunit PriX [Sulfolobus sp. B5]TRM74256.1 DNA primase noncatalytic subunit PriX [Sulfolobus sp. E5]TRM78552.1 DNA primase noncatalytic subunit PriX [Sulfolobus sp. A20-N-F8]TRM81961.1 DNA primase noncatalytic subunit PriX [Sulfolobus sp. A20-N-F6]TRM82090.1 DNA primase noncatalytic subunit PriX [Sulfolobus sp. D5]TRM88256.1 DNA primase noncatalytic subunit PriX [Sulfolobus sp. E3]TRM89817.1 DNA 